MPSGVAGELLLLFLLVVCFVFLLYFLLFLQRNLGNTNFCHPEHNGLVGPLVEILKTLDPLSAGHHVAGLNGPGSYFQTFV